MALDLRHNVLAGKGHPIDFAAQGVDNVTEGFVTGDSIVGVLDPELDRAGDLAFVSGEGGPVEGDLGWFRRRRRHRCKERVCLCEVLSRLAC